MEYHPITVSAKRTGKSWTATATINGEFVSSCTTKSKAYAEKEARKGAEHYRRNMPVQQKPQPVPAIIGSYRGPISGLTTHLQARATTATNRMVMAMAVLLCLASCAQKSLTKHTAPAWKRIGLADRELSAPDSTAARLH